MTISQSLKDKIYFCRGCGIDLDRHTKITKVGFFLCFTKEEKKDFCLEFEASSISTFIYLLTIEGMTLLKEYLIRIYYIKNCVNGCLFL